ncbi:hypothetical protein ACFSTH_01130 [Paenibacillus yanchengensis]
MSYCKKQLAVISLKRPNFQNNRNYRVEGVRELGVILLQYVLNIVVLFCLVALIIKLIQSEHKRLHASLVAGFLFLFLSVYLQSDYNVFSGGDSNHSVDWLSISDEQLESMFKIFLKLSIISFAYYIILKIKKDADM